jgi:hypothetical protein
MPGEVLVAVVPLVGAGLPSSPHEVRGAGAAGHPAARALEDVCVLDRHQHRAPAPGGGIEDEDERLDVGDRLDVHPDRGRGTGW